MIKRFETYLKLGVLNLFYVLLYRLKIKSGWYKAILPIKNSINGVYFDGALVSNFFLECPVDAQALLEKKMSYFSHKLVEVTNPPSWLRNPSFKSISNNFHWSEIDDFSNGDIKLIWEPSRFQWVVHAAQGFVSTNNIEFINILNLWLNDWSNHNPTNQGINWKCGQEASMRVINLILATYLLGEINNPKESVVKMIVQHCERIDVTWRYAYAQNNNHGTTEAAAIFIGGSWLKYIGRSDNLAQKWSKKGRDFLEERVNNLVMDDGTFSQYSTNYHRLLLDSLSLAEFFRQKFNQREFSAPFVDKVNLATNWLWQIVDYETGKAPNMGANDGTQLLQFAENDFRDFRPSIQLASFLFENCLYYNNESNGILNWLNLDLSNASYMEKSPKTTLFENGGFISIIGNKTSGLLSYPNYKFRPSQADMLNFDLMDRGEPIVLDGGTYSYNDFKWSDYFSGIKSHNTIQFDNDEPMPRLSRFLFSEWPQGKLLSQKQSNEASYSSVEYTDSNNRNHKRQVTLQNRTWVITDVISNFSNLATLRWRLLNTNWAINKNEISSDKASIIVSSDNNIASFALRKGYQSNYYNELSEISVLEVTLNKPCTITTVIKLPD